MNELIQLRQQNKSLLDYIEKQDLKNSQEVVDELDRVKEENKELEKKIQLMWQWSTGYIGESRKHLLYCFKGYCGFDKDWSELEEGRMNDWIRITNCQTTTANGSVEISRAQAEEVAREIGWASKDDDWVDELRKANNEFGSETEHWPNLWKRIAQLKNLHGIEYRGRLKAQKKVDELILAMNETGHLLDKSQEENKEFRQECQRLIHEAAYEKQRADKLSKSRWKLKDQILKLEEQIEWINKL